MGVIAAGANPLLVIAVVAAILVGFVLVLGLGSDLVSTLWMKTRIGQDMDERSRLRNRHRQFQQSHEYYVAFSEWWSRKQHE